MPIQTSPGVNVSELDLTTVVPAVATTTGAIGGVFRWGPSEKITLIDSEAALVSLYGKPHAINYETWFTASNFLSYGNQLYVSRSITSNTNSAVATSGTIAIANNQNVKNDDDYEIKASGFDANCQFIAKFGGDLGNTLKISVCGSSEQFRSSINLQSNTTFQNGNTVLSVAIGSQTGNLIFANTGVATNANMATAITTTLSSLTVNDYIEVGNNTIGKQYLKVKSIGATTVYNDGANVAGSYVSLTFDDVYKLSTPYSSNTVTRAWEYYNTFSTAPGQSAYVAASGNTLASDELHIVVVDEDGLFSGSAGVVLETYQGLSRATDAKTLDGAANYYKTVLNNSSAYVWAASNITSYPVATAPNVASVVSGIKAFSASFAAGTDGVNESNVPFGSVALAYDRFKSADLVDISLVMTGKSIGGINGEQVGNYIIDNVTSTRKDCVAFISPAKEDVVNVTQGVSLDSIVQFRNSLRSSSYAVLDSGYKYQYDKYNDTYRWVPLNGDIAGLCARTDLSNDPWFSPAGATRGAIKNSIKLAFNPSKADRDVLYNNGVNPVVTFSGQGTILYGDKTLLAKPSAFDRINVRRLFIVLEKAIARAAESTLFEFNDYFTRATFVNYVEPYLRDVRSRRGITDFRVVCDETNNTQEVIDSNRFVGDIYIKPSRSVNFIQLNFVAVRSGLEFNEIIG